MTDLRPRWPKGTLPDVIERGIAYTDAHYAEPLTAAEVAKATASSPSHFSRLFHESTGLTWQEYLVWVRLDEARRLLRDHPSWNIERVARDVGWSGRSLQRWARRRLGQTPNALRGDS